MPRSRRRAAVWAASIALALAVWDVPVAQGLNGLMKGLLENADSIGSAISNADKLLGNFSDEEERQIGRAAAQVLLGASPRYADRDVQRYVNQLGTWLALHTERPNLEWTFVVLDDTTANAFAAPGGYVFVTRGLLALMRNETELAGVLAHEIAHVLAKHHLAAVTSQERFKLVTDIAVAATDTQGPIGDALAGVTREVYSKGLEQGDEYEADRMGVVIAARAGYDAYGLMHALMTLNAIGDNQEVMGFFVSTHPPTGERIEQLDTLLAGRFDVPTRPTPRAFQRMQARLSAN